jgi:MoaA/NifB/PqqE/SkfB family radical SAM enzyme
MLKIYREHSEFDEFTKYDTTTGRLDTITSQEFRQFLPANINVADHNDLIRRVEYNGNSIFLGEISETHVRFPRRIYFQITRNCNLLCDYCFIKSRPGDPHVPKQTIFKIAEFMGKCGLMEVRLTGGEPTTHPDLLSIMDKFKEEGIYISLATNGLWDRFTLDALCEESYLWVIVSIDGARETHNKYRPGTFDRIIENLRILRKHNPSVRIRLTTVLTKDNMNQMMELGEICASVQAESITIIPLRPQVRDPHITSRMVTAQQFKYVIEDLIRAKEKFNVPFTTTMETSYKNEIYRDPIVRKRSSCAAGREATNLDYDAAKKEFVVYACSYSPASDLTAPIALRRPFLAGTFTSANVDSFLKIWRDEQVWKIYRDLSIRSRECKGCLYFKNHQCTGSCPIQNIDYSSIDVNRDVLQQLKEQIIHTGEWYCYQSILNE